MRRKVFSNQILAKSNCFIEHSSELMKQIGKKTEFELGRYLRKRCNSFLGNTFSSDQVYVRSTSESRTLKSAQYALAGLLLPRENESLKRFKKNQTVPIRTIPLDEDYLLYPGQTCPQAEKQISEYLESNEIQRLFDKYSGLRQYLAENSGSPADTITDLYNIADVLFVENGRFDRRNHRAKLLSINESFPLYSEFPLLGG